MGRSFLTVFILLTGFFLFDPRGLTKVEAVHPNHCIASKPSIPPILTSAVPGDKSVTLTWIETPDRVTNYVLSYSIFPDRVEYGNPDIGIKGTTSYTIGGLQNGVKYYFKIRGVNNCHPGKLSNRLYATPGTTAGAHGPNLAFYKSVLGASTSAKKVPSVMSAKPVCPTCRGWQILLGEVLLLLLYFYFGNKSSLLEKVASVVIPLAAYIIFLNMNSACSKYVFWCKYFLPLDAIIYIFIVVTYKHRYIHKKTNLLGRSI